MNVILRSLGIRKITMQNGRCIGGAGVGARRPEETQVGDNEGPDQGRRGGNRGDRAVLTGGIHGASCPKA